jgi:hypothetical protein
MRIDVTQVSLARVGLLAAIADVFYQQSIRNDMLELRPQSLRYYIYLFVELRNLSATGCSGRSKLPLRFVFHPNSIDAMLAIPCIMQPCWVTYDGFGVTFRLPSGYHGIPAVNRPLRCSRLKAILDCLPR